MASAIANIIETITDNDLINMIFAIIAEYTSAGVEIVADKTDALDILFNDTTVAITTVINDARRRLIDNQIAVLEAELAELIDRKYKTSNKKVWVGEGHGKGLVDVNFINARRKARMIELYKINIEDLKIERAEID